MGPPLVALFSACRIGCGKVAIPVGRAGVAELFAVDVDDGSFELQLDTPNAASNPNEITVQATRNGVQNLTLLSSLFIPDIASLLFAKPE